VGNAGRHLAQRGQAIAQPLALLELLDAGEVLEEHHGANRRPRVVFDLGQRVADDAIQLGQPQLGAIRQVTELEGAREHADDGRPFAQHLGKRPSGVVGLARQAEDPIALVVHQRQGAVAPKRDDAVAHTADDVAEKAVVQRQAGNRRGVGGSRRGPAAGRAEVGSRRRVGHRYAH
jgi:hypothetical protein